MRNEREQAILRDIARASIAHGLASGRPLAVDPATHDAALRTHGATFVTLELDDDLRGCIGTLEAYRPLVLDIAHNAFNAAFRDPRFPPVSAIEADLLDIHISVLTAPEPMLVRDEEDLLARLRPGIDGLVLSEGGRRGTFLPSVWEQLPDRRAFLTQLKRKAGLPANHWSATLKVERYTVQEF